MWWKKILQVLGSVYLLLKYEIDLRVCVYLGKMKWVVLVGVDGKRGTGGGWFLLTGGLTTTDNGGAW